MNVLKGNNINQNISLPQFDLEVELGDDYATDYYDLAYPGVIMKVILRRKVSFHLMQTYIPSSIFVVVAWLSVFIPPEQVPGTIVCISIKAIKFVWIIWIFFGSFTLTRLKL